MLTDDFLIMNEHGSFSGKRWQAVYENSTRFFTAKNVTEARYIAREYGTRFLHQRCLCVSFSPEGEE